MRIRLLLALMSIEFLSCIEAGERNAPRSKARLSRGSQERLLMAAGRIACGYVIGICACAALAAADEFVDISRAEDKTVAHYSETPTCSPNLYKLDGFKFGPPSGNGKRPPSAAAMIRVTTVWGSPLPGEKIEDYVFVDVFDSTSGQRLAQLELGAPAAAAVQFCVSAQSRKNRDVVSGEESILITSAIADEIRAWDYGKGSEAPPRDPAIHWKIDYSYVREPRPLKCPPPEVDNAPALSDRATIAKRAAENERKSDEKLQRQHTWRGGIDIDLNSNSNWIEHMSSRFSGLDSVARVAHCYSDMYCVDYWDNINLDSNKICPAHIFKSP